MGYLCLYLEYSAGSGVKRIHCVLLVLIFRLLFVSHVLVLSKYCCNCIIAIL